MRTSAARSSFRRPVTLGTQIALAALSLLVLLGSGYAWATYRSVVTSLHTFTFVPPAQDKPRIDGKDQNILLVGDDSRDNASAAALKALGTEANGGENTDTVMLLHVPANGRSASLISIPRDALVQIPSEDGLVKINAAYADGLENGNHLVAAGAARLAQTITALTGLRVDHFVKVSLLGFYDISVAIHGIDVDLCAAQNDPYSGFNQTKGIHHLEGLQALAFVRQRHGPPGFSDYTRVARQQYFLSAVFRKLATPQKLGNVIETQRLARAIGKSLTVDTGFAGSSLLNLAAQMKDLSAGSLQTATIPMTGSVGEGDNYQGEGVDRAAMPAFINKIIGVPASPKPSATSSHPSATTPSATPSASATKTTPAAPPLSEIAGATSDPAIHNAGQSGCIP